MRASAVAVPAAAAKVSATICLVKSVYEGYEFKFADYH